MYCAGRGASSGVADQAAGSRAHVDVPQGAGYAAAGFGTRTHVQPNNRVSGGSTAGQGRGAHLHPSRTFQD